MFTNSADPDKTAHSEPSHLDLRSLLFAIEVYGYIYYQFFFFFVFVFLFFFFFFVFFFCFVFLTQNITLSSKLGAKKIK